MIYFAADVETTGLSWNTNDIIEVGFVAFDPVTYLPTGTKFSSRIRPLNLRAANPEAFKVNKISPVELEKAPPMAQVRSIFLEWKHELFGSEKIVPLGQNYDGFDKYFIIRWLSKDLYDAEFDYHSKDSQKIAEICIELELLKTENNSSSLNQVGKAFGLGPSEHSALADATRSLTVYRECMNLLKSYTRE